MDLYRKKIVVANWKMNLSLEEGEALVREIMQGTSGNLSCEVVVAPPFTHLTRLKEITDGSQVHIAAQNCHFEPSGAFTGEVSAMMLKSLGIDYVIVGHSERRHFFHETNEIVKLKVDAILAAGLKPIFCCGEPAEIRDTETQNIFVRMQLEESLFHLSEAALKNICIAYEPIWAIGTGLTASPEQVQEMHMYIRDQVVTRYNKIVGEEIRILYGGSIKPDNAKSLFTQEDVDGGLVGGSSLNGPGFIEVINAACG